MSYNRVVVVTGGFDPIHSGHIEYFKEAAKLGDYLVVGVNSDAWLTRKKGRPFMPLNERSAIVENLRMVNLVVTFDDEDGSACGAIARAKELFPNATIVFANGGDRTKTNIPEMDRYQDDPKVEFVFGVGGENKMNSSSWILTEWKAPKTERVWGYYRVLHEVPGMKVKELTVDPGKKLSMQRHEHRSEYWIVSEGKGQVNGIMNDLEIPTMAPLVTWTSLTIPQGEWHQLENTSDVPLRIVEIQYGDKCVEEDIERK